MTTRAPDLLKRLNPIDFTFIRSEILRGSFICQSHFIVQLCNSHQQIQAWFKRLKARPTARLQSKIVAKFQILNLNNFFSSKLDKRQFPFVIFWISCFFSNFMMFRFCEYEYQKVANSLPKISLRAFLRLPKGWQANSCYLSHPDLGWSHTAPDL